MADLTSTIIEGCWILRFAVLRNMVMFLCKMEIRTVCVSVIFKVVKVPVFKLQIKIKAPKDVFIWC